MFYTYGKAIRIILSFEVKMQKYTLIEVRNLYKKRGLILLCDDYKNSKIKMPCQDENGYKYSLSLGDIQDYRIVDFDKFSSRNPFTIENLNLFIKDNKLSCILVSTNNPKSNKDKLCFRCKCGEEYWLHFNHFIMYKKDRCNKCSYTDRGLVYDYNTINQIVQNHGYTLLNKPKQLHSCLYIQDTQGYKYRTTLINVINNGRLLPFHYYNIYTKDNIINYLRIHNIGVSLVDCPEKIKIAEDYLTFSCAKCFSLYKALWSEICNNRRILCSHCSQKQSTLEFLVENYLKAQNLNYETQKRFDDCRKIKPLPFDFYLPEYNLVIEVNGSQHYYENQVFKQNLELRQEYDKIKKEYCVENNIKYVEIPFWHIKNGKEKEKYKEIIDNIINQN